MANPKGRFAYVRNPGGMTVDIPEKQLAETLKRGGFTFLGWADEAEAEIEELFADDDAAPTATHDGAYQRPQADEAAELAMLEGKDVPAAGETVVVAGVQRKSRVGLKERETIRKAAKKTPKKAVKKAVKKTAKK